MEQSSEFYAYDDLPASNFLPFRILILQPGDYDEKLQCSLQTCPLHSPPLYEALSYTWRPCKYDNKAGTPTASQGASDLTTGTQQVYFNDSKHVIIGSNLHNALKRLRYTSHTRVLWVDQICINQSDLAE